MSRDHQTSGIVSFDFSKSIIVIVQSVYHSDITNELFNGALTVLKNNKVGEIHHMEMPGAYELVYGASKSYELIENLNGIITIGCVIKGDTDHDQYINQAVASGLISLEQQFKVPIGFGLLTTNNHQQAIDRSGGKHGNKGKETALAVLKCLSSSLIKNI